MATILDIDPLEYGDTSLVKIETNFQNLNTDTAQVQSNLTAHENDLNNPHSVTKAQVGLSNVDNTSDANKPVSSATQSALNIKQSKSEKGVANGYASLDSGGKVPLTQIPATTGTGDMQKLTYDPADISEQIVGETATQTLTNKTIEDGILTGSVKLPFSTSPVVNEDGKIAIDTDVTGFSHALLRFFGTEEQFLPSLPVTQLSSLSNGYVISYNAVTEEFELVAQNTPGTGDTTYINTTQIDSSAGTSSTYGLLSGAINGINTVFTVSNGAYVSGSLVVFRNGKELVQGTGEDWTQTSSASGTFTFNTAPTTGDVIDVFYNKQETTSSSLILDKDTKTVSTNYTVLPTDRNILVNASSGDITITLTTSIDSVGVHIKKIDTSGNIVTIATPGSQTIDNDSTKTIETPYYSKSIIYDGSNYFII